MGKDICVYAGGFEMPDKNAAAHQIRIYGKILEEIGYQVVFIGVDHMLKYDSDILASKKEMGQFECYAIGYPRTFRDWMAFTNDSRKYIDVLRSLENVKAVILYNFPALPLKGVLKYCKRNNIKCYANATEWYSGKGRGIIWGAVKCIDTSYRMRVMHSRTDGIITVSSYLEDYYKKHPHVMCIPVLIDNNEEQWKNDYIKSKAVLNLVYAGSPGYKDRLDIIIEALRKVKRRCKLDIIGITLEEYLKLYNKQQADTEIGDNIVFHGRLPHNVVLEYIKKANYSCFFRDDTRLTRAGFPSKAVEAIGCGTPVITNNTSDLAQYITNGVNGYLLSSPIDSDEITNTFENAKHEVKVDSSKFDYRNYIAAFKHFFNQNGDV